MFLKNISLFRMTRKLGIKDLNDLNHALKRRAYRNMSKMERVNDGFVPPMPTYRPEHVLYVGRKELDWVEDEDSFVHKPFPFAGFGADDEALVVMFFREEKVIVSQDIKRKVQEAVNEIEKDQGRKVYSKERAELKDKFITEVMPHAQTRYWQAPVIFFSEGLVLVGEVGAKAEMVMSALREILGTFPVVPLLLKNDVPMVLTYVAKTQGKDDRDPNLLGFQVADDFQFQALEEHPAVARMKRTDVADENVQNLMFDKAVTHANLLWQDKASFKLDPKFAIRKLKIMDSAFEDLGEQDSDDLAGANYASAMIEHSVFMDMLGHLVELFGGERELDRGINDKESGKEIAYEDQPVTYLQDLDAHLEQALGDRK